MRTTRDMVLEVLYQSLTELNEQRSSDQHLLCSPNTPLDEGALDSLSFVNFVALVEEKCQEVFGKTIVLSEVTDRSGGTDPFCSVGSLADCIASVLLQCESLSK